jgi:transcription termination/antitermination protein NusA
MTMCPLQEALTARVPELAQHSVEIVAVAREPGLWAKVAVRSHVPGMNAVGICIGWAGVRIADVEKRLHGERVSIVDFDSDPTRYVINALAIRSATAEITDADHRRIRVYVDPTDCPRALGKAGHNVRLARQLTGWAIYICTSDGGPSHAPSRSCDRLTLTH